MLHHVGVISLSVQLPYVCAHDHSVAKSLELTSTGHANDNEAGTHTCINGHS